MRPRKLKDDWSGSGVFRGPAAWMNAVAKLLNNIRGMDGVFIVPNSRGGLDFYGETASAVPVAGASQFTIRATATGIRVSAGTVTASGGYVGHAVFDIAEQFEEVTETRLVYVKYTHDTAHITGGAAGSAEIVFLESAVDEAADHEASYQLIGTATYTDDEPDGVSQESHGPVHFADAARGHCEILYSPDLNHGLPAHFEVVESEEATQPFLRLAPLAQFGQEGGAYYAPISSHSGGTVDAVTSGGDTTVLTNLNDHNAPNGMSQEQFPQWFKIVLIRRL